MKQMSLFANKIPSKLIAFLAILLLVFSFLMLGGCAKNSEDVLRETVQNEFNAYKNLEDAALEKIANTAEEEGLSELGISGADFASAVLDGFDYNITGVKIENEAATVSVMISSKSATDFESKLSKKVQEFVDSNQAAEMSTEEKNNKIGSITMEAFGQTEIINEEAQIHFQLQDKTWVSTNASEVLAQLDSLVFAG